MTQKETKKRANSGGSRKKNVKKLLKIYNFLNV